MEHAHLGELILEGGTPADLSLMCAERFQFRKIQVPQDDLVGFLYRTDPFSKETYRFVEKHLREQGKDKEADKIYREMIRRDRRQELGPILFFLDVIATAPLRKRTRRLVHEEAWPRLTKWWTSFRQQAPGTQARSAVKFVFRIPDRVARALPWVWNVLLDWWVGHGTQSYRLASYLLLMWLVMICTFTFIPEIARWCTTTTIQDTQQFPEKYSADIPPTDQWGLTQGFGLGTRVTFPMLSVFMAKDWEPSTATVFSFYLPFVEKRAVWLQYDTLAGIVGLMHYVAVPLFLVSVSGLLKKRGEE